MMLKNLLFRVLIIGSVLIFGFKSDNNPSNASKNKVVFKGIKSAHVPFSYVQSTKIEIINNKLNIAAMDKNGDMLQIIGIDISDVKNGILRSDAFRTVYISSKNGTYTDNDDTSSSSLVEIKCINNKPGNNITIGLKTNLSQNKKTIRAYATLTCILPSYTFTETQN